MVATRSADQGIVDFVTGMTMLGQQAIGVEEWVQILRAAINELPINYMRRLKSIKQILQYDGTYGIARRIDGPLPLLQTRKIDPRDDKYLPPNAVFLDCAETYENFPSTYSEAPRATGEYGPNTGELLPIRSRHVLLARDRALYFTSVLWRPQERWDEKSMSDTPEEFWYQIDMNQFELEELSDRELVKLFESTKQWAIPRVMLHRFNSALIETARDVRGQYDRIQEKKQIIAGYLKRIGDPGY